MLRNLVSNTIVAKFEGHSQSIKAITFAMPPPEEVGKQVRKYAFVSCAGTETLLWDFAPSDISSGRIEEILQPAKILDSQSMNSIVSVQAHQVMEGLYMVSALSDQRSAYVFMAKVSSSSKSKSKVKKPDSTITLKEKSHEFISLRVASDTSLSVVFGNIFSLNKQNVALLNSQNEKGSPQIRAQIELEVA